MRFVSIDISSLQDEPPDESKTPRHTKIKYPDESGLRAHALTYSERIPSENRFKQYDARLSKPDPET